jgi:hypothetical protein
MKLQYRSKGDSYFQIRTTKMVPQICFFPFLKYIFGIRDCEKLKYFEETSTL